MEEEYGTYSYENYKSVEKENIKFWQRQAGFIITFDISCMMHEEANKNESIMSIELVIDGDQGK